MSLKEYEEYIRKPHAERQGTQEFWTSVNKSAFTLFPIGTKARLVREMIKGQVEIEDGAVTAHGWTVGGPGASYPILGFYTANGVGQSLKYNREVYAGELQKLDDETV